VQVPVDLDAKLFDALAEEATIQQQSMDVCIQIAIHEFLENRAYVRSGKEERRRLMRKLQDNPDQ